MADKQKPGMRPKTDSEQRRAKQSAERAREQAVRDAKAFQTKSNVHNGASISQSGQRHR